MKDKILIMFDCFGVVQNCLLLPYFISRFGEIEGRKYNEHYSKIGDMGEITLKEMALEMSKITKEKPEDIYNFWIDKVQVIEGMKELLKTLKEKYYVVLASNAMEGIVEDTFKKNDLYPYFDKIFISYKYKDVKPNKSYYLRIINSFDFEFEKIYMVDDYERNLEYLKEINVKGILFKNIAQLIDEFKKDNII